MSVDSLRGAAPVFPVSDVDATANWYRDALGFEFDMFPKTPPFSRRAGRPNGYVVVFAEQTSGADP